MRRTIAAATLAMLFAAPAIDVHAGTIAGRVAYTGAPLPPRHIQMTADPVCDRMHPSGIASQTLRVAADGAVEGVVVSVTQGLPKKQTYAAPASPVTLDERGCMLVPHVLGIQTGQILEITNRDATMHSVHAAPAVGNGFDIEMPLLDQVVRKKFDASEVVHIKCDVHPWMSAYVAVFDHPFFAVTGEDGRYAIGNLPAGTYTMQAWHETLGLLTAVPVKISDDHTATADFSFAGN